MSKHSRTPKLNRATPPVGHFLALAQTYTMIPVFRTVTADLETPVSAFLRVAADMPEAFLLESVEGGERVGRYTFIGIRPYKTLESRGTSIVLTSGKKKRRYQGDIFAELKLALGQHTPARLPGLPPFTAGAVGFFAYDVVRQIERLPELAAEELGVPDACLMFFDEVMAFDHVKKEIFLIATADLLREPDPEKAYRKALKRLDRMERELNQPLPKPVQRKLPQQPLEITPRTPKTDYLQAVGRIQKYIVAGDIFQCVLSQRFDCKPGVEAFDIYRALRIVNPSPYMYYFRFPFGAHHGKSDSLAHIAGSSPELLVRVHGRRIEYHPIAGTRPRDEDDATDRALEQSLLHDEKEIAEHVMLVDLGRNDLGRVSSFGSVRVNDLMHVERYSHVMHLVSGLEGNLRDDMDAIDALRSCFPAGTLSGAPKIRAMEIIEELEPARRGVYGGAILYADFSGNLDSCIAIRTLFMQDKTGHIQAGGGVVADSVPETEYQETVNKAKAVIRAIERARGDISGRRE